MSHLLRRKWFMALAACLIGLAAAAAPRQAKADRPPTNFGVPNKTFIWDGWRGKGYYTSLKTRNGWYVQSKFINPYTYTQYLLYKTDEQTRSVQLAEELIGSSVLWYGHDIFDSVNGGRSFKVAIFPKGTGGASVHRNFGHWQTTSFQVGDDGQHHITSTHNHSKIGDGGSNWNFLLNVKTKCYNATYYANGGTITRSDPNITQIVAGQTYRSTMTPGTNAYYALGLYARRHASSFLGYKDRSGSNVWGWKNTANGVLCNRGTRFWDWNSNWRYDGDTSFNAMYSYYNYNVRYQLGGGSFGKQPPARVSYPDQFTVPIPYRRGYTFDGWEITGMHHCGDRSCKSYINGNATTADSIGSTKATTFKQLSDWNNSTVTFRAKWHANTYKVVYAPNNNYKLSVWNQNVTPNADQPIGTVKYGEPLSLGDDVPFARNLYEFYAWSITPNNTTGTMYQPGQTIPDFANRWGKENGASIDKDGMTIRVYAIWLPKTRVRFNLSCAPKISESVRHLMQKMSYSADQSVKPGDNGWYNLTGATYEVKSFRSDDVVTIDHPQMDNGVQTAYGYVYVSSNKITYQVQSTGGPKKANPLDMTGRDFDPNKASGYLNDGCNAMFTTGGLVQNNDRDGSPGTSTADYCVTYNRKMYPDYGTVRVERYSDDNAITSRNRQYDLQGAVYEIGEPRRGAAQGFSNILTNERTLAQTGGSEPCATTEEVRYVKFGVYRAHEIGASKGYYPNTGADAYADSGEVNPTNRSTRHQVIHFYARPYTVKVILDKVSSHPNQVAGIGAPNSEYDLSGALYRLSVDGSKATGNGLYAIRSANGRPVQPVSEMRTLNSIDIAEFRADVLRDARLMFDSHTLIDDYVNDQARKLTFYKARTQWVELPLGSYTIVEQRDNDGKSGALHYLLDETTHEITVTSKQGQSRNVNGVNVETWETESLTAGADGDMKNTNRYDAKTFTYTERSYEDPELPPPLGTPDDPNNWLVIVTHPKDGVTEAGKTHEKNTQGYYSTDGARYAIYRDKECKRLFTVIDGSSSGGGGGDSTLTTNYIPYGRWYIRQITPPRNYELTREAQPVEIVPDAKEPSRLTFDVEPELGRLVAWKSSADPVTTVSNANFDLNRDGQYGVYRSEDAALEANQWSVEAIKKAKTEARNKALDVSASVKKADGSDAEPAKATVGTTPTDHYDVHYDPGAKELANERVDIRNTMAGATKLDDATPRTSEGAATTKYRYSAEAALWSTRSLDASSMGNADTYDKTGYPANELLAVGDWYLAETQAPYGYYLRDAGDAGERGDAMQSAHVIGRLDLQVPDGRELAEFDRTLYTASNVGLPSNDIKQDGVLFATVLEESGGHVYEVPIVLSKNKGAVSFSYKETDELSGGGNGKFVAQGTVGASAETLKYGNAVWYMSAGPDEAPRKDWLHETQDGTLKPDLSAVVVPVPGGGGEMSLARPETMDERNVFTDHLEAARQVLAAYSGYACDLPAEDGTFKAKTKTVNGSTDISPMAFTDLPRPFPAYVRYIMAPSSDVYESLGPNEEPLTAAEKKDANGRYFDKDVSLAQYNQYVSKAASDGNRQLFAQLIKGGNYFRHKSEVVRTGDAVHAIPFEWPLALTDSRADTNLRPWEDRPYQIGISSTDPNKKGGATLKRDYKTVTIARQQSGADDTTRQTRTGVGENSLIWGEATGTTNDFVWRQYVPLWVSDKKGYDAAGHSTIPKTFPNGDDVQGSQLSDVGTSLPEVVAAGGVRLPIYLAPQIERIGAEHDGIYPDMRAHESDPDWYPTKADGSIDYSRVIKVYECYTEIHSEGVQIKSASTEG